MIDPTTIMPSALPAAVRPASPVAAGRSPHNSDLLTTQGCAPQKPRKRQKPRDSNEEFVRFARRILRALGSRVGSEFVIVDDLLLFRDLEAEIQAQFARAVNDLRVRGISNTDIARTLEVSRQAVAKRWPVEGREP